MTSKDRRDELLGVEEAENSSCSDDDVHDNKSSTKLVHIRDEVVAHPSSAELDLLGSHVKDIFDAKLLQVNPKAASYKADPNSEFDKLRRRVSYLSYGKRSSGGPVIPANMQIHN